MDILVSSNLERLLYFLSKDTERVAGWMKQLSDEGRYDVGPELRAAVRRDFEAGFCGDAETAEEIARVWRENGYLIDTHTAVASRVLREYRARSGDGTPAVVVSTASPYKFCDSVLRALGVETDAPGTELIGRLERPAGKSRREGGALRHVRGPGGAEEGRGGISRLICTLGRSKGRPGGSAAALLLEGGAAGLAGALGALAVDLDVGGGAAAALLVVGAVFGVAADGGRGPHMPLVLVHHQDLRKLVWVTSRT